VRDPWWSEVEARNQALRDESARPDEQSLRAWIELLVEIHRRRVARRDR